MIVCEFSLDDVIEMLHKEGVEFTGEHFSRDYKDYLKRFNTAKALILVSNPELTGKLLPIENPRTMIYRLTMNMSYDDKRAFLAKYNRKFIRKDSKNPFKPEHGDELVIIF